MLHSKHPGPLELNQYLNRFSGHRRSTAATIGRDSRFKSRTFHVPGPGTYRAERDYPEREEDDIGTCFRTGIQAPPKYSIPTEARIAPDGSLKGMSPGPGCNPLGPGQYPLYRLGMCSKEVDPPSFTIPRAKETAEALRERKKRSDVPGPGVYEIPRYGDELGHEKQKAMERAVRRGTRCWAAAEYSHIYHCMKPRSGSLPALLSPEAGTKTSSRHVQPAAS